MDALYASPVAGVLGLGFLSHLLFLFRAVNACF